MDVKKLHLPQSFRFFVVIFGAFMENVIGFWAYLLVQCECTYFYVLRPLKLKSQALLKSSVFVVDLKSHCT